MTESESGHILFTDCADCDCCPITDMYLLRSIFYDISFSVRVGGDPRVGGNELSYALCSG